MRIVLMNKGANCFSQYKWLIVAWLRCLRRSSAATACVLVAVVVSVPTHAGDVAPGGVIPPHAHDALHLGMISDKPSKTINRFLPLMTYLAEHGIPVGEIITASSIDEMIDLFRLGKVDYIFESAFGAISIMDAVGAEPVLIREKKGVRDYKSAIFVPSDSPIQTISDLAGKVIAFEDPTSTSSYVLPLQLIKAAGLSVQKSDTPTPGVVSYYFSGDDYNTLVQVRKGNKADAGGIKVSMIEGKPYFRMLDPTSVMVPRHVVVVRKGLDHTRLVTVLLNMSTDPSAKVVLKRAKTPTGFSRFEDDPKQVMDTSVRAALGL